MLPVPLGRWQTWCLELRTMVKDIYAFWEVYNIISASAPVQVSLMWPVLTSLYKGDPGMI